MVKFVYPTGKLSHQHKERGSFLLLLLFSCIFVPCLSLSDFTMFTEMEKIRNIANLKISRLDAHADVLKMKTKKGITKNKM